MLTLASCWRQIRAVPFTVGLALLFFLLAAVLPMLAKMEAIRFVDLALALLLVAVFSSTVLLRKPWGRVLIWVLCLWQIVSHVYAGLHAEHWIEHVARVLDGVVIVLLLLPASSAWFEAWKRPVTPT